jgi:hypothetical protein
MAAHNVLAEMGRLNLIPRDSAEWKTQRAVILDHLTSDENPGNRVVTADIHNNTGRFCSLRGDHANGRSWQVQDALTGGRYLVRHVTTGEEREVTHSHMSNLY